MQAKYGKIKQKFKSQNITQFRHPSDAMHVNDSSDNFDMRVESDIIVIDAIEFMRHLPYTRAEWNTVYAGE